MWGCDDYKLKGELFGHEKEKSVYFIDTTNSTGKDILISGGSDKSIRIWDIVSMT